MTEIIITQNNSRVLVKLTDQKTRQETHIYNMPKIQLEDIIELVIRQLINDGCDFTKESDFISNQMRLELQNLYTKKV